MPTMNPIQKPTPADAEELRYAHSMGHTHAVVTDDKRRGRVLAGQCSDAKTARRWAKDGENSTAYVLTDRGWRVLPPELTGGE